MDRDEYCEFVEKSREPEVVEKTIGYLSVHLEKFLRKNERERRTEGRFVIAMSP